VGLLPIATAADASRPLSAFPRQWQSAVIVSRRCDQSARRCSAVRAHRRVSGRLLPRSIQLGIAVAPRLPHRVHRMCRVNDGTGTSSGQASTLTSVLLPQARQVAKSERTPRLRMLPSVMGGLVRQSGASAGILSQAATCGNRLGRRPVFSIIGPSRLPTGPNLDRWRRGPLAVCSVGFLGPGVWREASLDDRC
jgi:hypothetical protein